MNVGLLGLQILVLVIMVVSLASLVVPIVPGLVIMWVAALIYGLVTHFDLASGIIFGVITLLMLVGNVSDNILMGASARQRGASWLSIGISIVAAIAGTFIWPPFGGFVFALVAVFVVELIRWRELRKAWDALRGMATGCGWSFVVRFSIGLLIIILFVIWAFLLPAIRG
jgi:uncharacterized protein YqgC (DUF456 family)